MCTSGASSLKQTFYTGTGILGVGCNTNDFFSHCAKFLFLWTKRPRRSGSTKGVFKDALAHGNFGDVHNLFLCFC